MMIREVTLTTPQNLARCRRWISPRPQDLSLRPPVASPRRISASAARCCKLEVV